MSKDMQESEVPDQKDWIVAVKDEDGSEVSMFSFSCKEGATSFANEVRELGCEAIETVVADQHVLRH